MKMFSETLRFSGSRNSSAEGTTRHSSGSLPSSRVPRRESSALVKLYLKQTKRSKLNCHLTGHRRAREKPVVHICFSLKWEHKYSHGSYISPKACFWFQMLTINIGLQTATTHLLLWTQQIWKIWNVAWVVGQRCGSATHDEIGEVIVSVIVPVLLLFPVDWERVVVVLRVAHLWPEKIMTPEPCAKAPFVCLKAHQCVPMVPARRNVANISCVLLSVLVEGEIDSDRR